MGLKGYVLWVNLFQRAALQPVVLKSPGFQPLSLTRGFLVFFKPLRLQMKCSWCRYAAALVRRAKADGRTSGGEAGVELAEASSYIDDPSSSSSSPSSSSSCCCSSSYYAVDDAAADDAEDARRRQKTELWEQWWFEARKAPALELLARLPGRVGYCTFHRHFAVKTTVWLMTAAMIHVTNLTPPRTEPVWSM